MSDSLSNIPLHGLILTNDIIDDAHSFRVSEQLHFCSRDGSRIRRALSDYKIGDATFSTYDEENWATVLPAITQFFAAKEDDIRFFYFAGHGFRDDNGSLYLLLRDSKYRDLAGSTIPAEVLKHIIEKSPARRKIIILDCCYSAAFFSRLRGRPVYIEELIQGQGTVVIASSSAAERARDGMESFTSFLVEGLETGSADRDGDGLVSLEEWFDYASDRIKDKQKPKMFYADRTSPIYIARLPDKGSHEAEPQPFRYTPSDGTSESARQPVNTTGQIAQPGYANETLMSPITSQTLVAKVRMLPPGPEDYDPKLVLSIRNFDSQGVLIQLITCRAQNIPQEQELGGDYLLAPSQQIDLQLPSILLGADNGLILIYTVVSGQAPRLALVTQIPTGISSLTKNRQSGEKNDDKDPTAEPHDPTLRPPSRTEDGPFNRRRLG